MSKKPGKTQQPKTGKTRIIFSVTESENHSPFPCLGQAGSCDKGNKLIVSCWHPALGGCCLGERLCSATELAKKKKSEEGGCQTLDEYDLEKSAS